MLFPYADEDVEMKKEEDDPAKKASSSMKKEPDTDMDWQAVIAKVGRANKSTIFL